LQLLESPFFCAIAQIIQLLAVKGGRICSLFYFFNAFVFKSRLLNVKNRQCGDKSGGFGAGRGRKKGSEEFWPSATALRPRWDTK